MVLAGITFAALAVGLWGLLVGAAHRLAKAAGSSAAAVRSPAPLVAVVFGGWLVVTLLFAFTGFAAQPGLPPRVPLLAMSGVVLLVSVSFTPPLARILADLPPAWPVALQTFRLPVELGLWSLYLADRIPEHMSFEGRNFDVLVGLTAPFMAWAVSRRRVGRRGLLLWNLLSLGLLVNIVGMAITSMPGLLHRPWPGVAPTVMFEAPYLWLPAWLVPLAVFGHVLSLRSLRRLPS